jgi:hypothetical protein
MLPVLQMLAMSCCFDEAAASGTVAHRGGGPAGFGGRGLGP